MSRDRHIWFLLPLGIGTAVAVAVAMAGLLPQWSKYQTAERRLEELRALEAQLPLLEQQLQSERQRYQGAQRQQGLVLQLIAGSGNLSTLMAELDRIAMTSAVELTLVEPHTTTSAANSAHAGPSRQDLTPDQSDTKLKDIQPLKTDPKNASNPGQKPQPQSDPLETQGLRRQTLLISARGRFPDLLSFMRKLELISVLAVQSNLQLELENRTNQDAGQSKPSPGLAGKTAAPARAEPTVTLKLNLNLYSQDSPPGLASSRSHRYHPSEG
jgi:type IV pilus assembly protein PilO